MNTEIKTKSTQKLTDVVTQMRDDQYEFFLNSNNEPTIMVPDDGFQQDWSADSQRIKDLIQSIYYELTGKVIKSSDRDFLMAQLREECRKGGRRLSQAEEAETDKDVIVQTMLSLFNNHEFFKGRTYDLLEKLRSIQDSGKIGYADELPVFINVFSRRFRRLIPTLKGYGLDASIEHKEDGSHCHIKRLDSFEPETTDGSVNESSGQSSGVSNLSGKELSTADGSDGSTRTDPPKTNDSVAKESAGQEGGAK